MVAITTSATSSMRARSIRKCFSPSARPTSSSILARLRTACAESSESASRSVAANAVTISILLQRTADGVGQAFGALRLDREIAGRLLRRDLDVGIRRDQLVRDRHALDDIDALSGQR